MKTNTEISKPAVLLAKEHPSDQKQCYKRFPYTFLQCNRSRKNDYQYIDVHHTKKQAENVLRLRSFLFLKANFHFISQCILELYLESALCGGQLHFNLYIAKKQTFS